jgi:hypothetical protein
MDDGPVSKGVGRRFVVTGLMMTAVAPAVAATPDKHLNVRKSAEALAAAMRELHGGDVWIHIDHETGVAAVSLIASRAPLA